MESKTVENEKPQHKCLKVSHEQSKVNRYVNQSIQTFGLKNQSMRMTDS